LWDFPAVCSHLHAPFLGRERTIADGVKIEYCAGGTADSAEHGEHCADLRSNRCPAASGGPLGFTIDDKKLKRAGLDYWHLLDITEYDGLDQFLCQNQDGAFTFFSTKARHLYSEVVYPDNAYLIFGREDAGLPEDLLYHHEEQCVRLPMIGGARSLNLSNTVAVGVYEVLRQWGFPALKCNGELTKYNWEG
jgi:tRNA (cytidine/uridine-2'-O-)-methyltransferase